MSENVTENAKTDLNTRRSMFIAAYLETGNATQSAKKAGYSAKCAHSQGMRLLKNAYIKAEIEKHKAQSIEKAGVTVDYIVKSLTEVAQRCMQKTPVMIRDGRDMVQKTEISEETGEEVGVWEFDSAGANRALELLGKYLKMFVDKVEVDASDDYAKALDRARERVYGVSKKV